MTHYLVAPVAASSCPHCGLWIDPRAWHADGYSPETGDLTICRGCARVLRFDRHMRLTAMTDRDERALLNANPDIKAQARQVALRLLSTQFSPQRS